MKRKILWLFVACSCAFLFVVQLRLPLKADEPTVQTTTEPYRFENLEGTWKVRLEKFKDYEIEDKRVTARDPSNPNGWWRSEHVITYKKNVRDVFKDASTVETAHLRAGIKHQKKSSLFWYELSGEEVIIECSEVAHTNGASLIDHRLERRAQGHVNSATGFTIYRSSHMPIEIHQMVVEEGSIRWINVKSAPKDETGCDDPKFPLQLLKEKPV